MDLPRNTGKAAFLPPAKELLQMCSNHVWFFGLRHTLDHSEPIHAKAGPFSAIYAIFMFLRPTQAGSFAIKLKFHFAYYHIEFY